jgi:hypothetical protein
MAADLLAVPLWWAPLSFRSAEPDVGRHSAGSDKILVKSPKTAHHKGHETESFPMFPELEKPLQEVFDEAPEGSVHVITRYRSSNQNLRTELNRIVKRAGVVMWQKPFQNLRSTRETELMESYPAHVVCRWIGNSEAVAREHYLQTRTRILKRLSEKRWHTQWHSKTAFDGVRLRSARSRHKESQRFSLASFVVRCGTHQTINPARTRTWKIRTKI